MLGNTNNILITYIILINCVGIITMYMDKRFARNNQYRISERLLFGVALLGGVIGVWIGMFWFRHKTKKLKFTLGLPLIIILYSIIYIYYV